MPDSQNDKFPVPAAAHFCGRNLRFRPLAEVAERLGLGKQSILFLAFSDRIALWVPLDRASVVDWHELLDPEAAHGIPRWPAGPPKAAPRGALRRRFVVVELTPEVRKALIADMLSIRVRDVFSAKPPLAWRGSLSEGINVKYSDFLLDPQSAFRLRPRPDTWLPPPIAIAKRAAEWYRPFPALDGGIHAKAMRKPKNNAKFAVLVHELLKSATSNGSHESLSLNGRPNAHELARHVSDRLAPHVSTLRGFGEERIRKVISRAISATRLGGSQIPSINEAILGGLARLSITPVPSAVRKDGMIDAARLARYVSAALPVRIRELYDTDGIALVIYRAQQTYEASCDRLRPPTARSEGGDWGDDSADPPVESPAHITR